MQQQQQQKYKSLVIKRKKRWGRQTQKTMGLQIMRLQHSKAM
jgi:hypothetical protein